jgi:hypothetical protein
MALLLDEQNFRALIGKTRRGKCTPFIGAGVSPHPNATQIANDWAHDIDYPMSNKDDLTSVAQYLEVTVDRSEPIDRILELFAATPQPDYDNDHEYHRILADLALPLYITTNYDPFMTEALAAVGRKPKRLICDWNGAAAEFNAEQMEVEEPTAWPLPCAESPWVFHLHGADVIPQSIVITEDDYLDFLANLQKESYKSKDSTIIPHYVIRAVSSTSLLFVGYSLVDWTFKVLFRGIRSSLPEFDRGMSAHFALQLPRNPEEQAYLASYLEKGIDVRVFWGDRQQFFNELRERWDASRISG